MTFRSKRFVVAGLGESGLAMATWLHRQGATVTVADSRADPPNRAKLAAVAPEIRVIAGPFDTATFASADAVALSPGLSPAMPEIAAAQKPLVSEVDLFVEARAHLAPESRMLAITGSNGKTTTTALTAHLLNGAGVPAIACGNVSPALLDALMAALDTGALPRVWVLELSSFQLEITRFLGAQAATVLNLSEDHLDRHANSMEAYAQAKARIFQGVPVRVVNRDDNRSLAMGDRGANMVTFGLDPAPRAGHYGIRDGAIQFGGKHVVALDELPLQGLHNAANVMAALALCRAVGVEVARVLPALKTFRGLPHRLEPVAEIAGISYIDDSKGTNVGATLAAIRGMGRPVAVVLGGDGKGQDFAPLKEALRRHGRAVALIGRDAAAIAAAIDGCGLSQAACANMEDAVRWLAGVAQAGDCVLLSPACASWDMYENYVARAAAFVAAVEKLRTAPKGRAS
ncbi:MAG: UDP-N-acetylmuramoyl-L-alanine--D-glutamate ligase [Zoogloeaceae bacterium]|jgi:UDP-N-acetylmuramoylalanine--D-glutamate ligase|nr:UDP-N-acetylmuramoyl-L-alanine--D-glutamate ligase [Zoogloeaceae bacterium]